MSVNQSHTQGFNGIILFNGERILLFAKDIRFGLSDVNPIELKGEWKGRAYLTTHRVIYRNDDTRNAALKSFSIPYTCMRNVELEQPVFGANHIKGNVVPDTNAGWTGQAKFKLWFYSGGAIEFGQAMMRAGQMALRNRTSDMPPPPRYESLGNVFAAPPPAYELYAGDPNYGWLPYAAFPSAPASTDVYMTDAPPPYPGVGPTTPMYTSPPPSQSLPPAYYDPNTPHTVHAQGAMPSAPPPEDGAQSYGDKKRN